MKRKPGGRKLPVLLLVLSTAAGGILLIRWLNPNNHLDFISAQVGKMLAGEVRLTAIDGGFSRGIWLQLKGVEINHSTLLPIDLSVSRVYARAALRPLLQRQLVIRQLLFEQPRVTYQLAAPEYADPPADSAQQDDGGGLPLQISLHELTLQHGALTIADQRSHPDNPVYQHFDKIDLNLNELATGQPTTFELSATSGKPVGNPDAQKEAIAAITANNDSVSDEAGGTPGSVYLKGILHGLSERFDLQSPWLEAVLSIKQWPLENAGTYLRLADPAQQFDGLLSANFSYQGDFNANNRALATINLGAARYYNPAWWPEHFPTTPLDLALKLDPQDDGRHRLALTLDTGELAVDGSALVAGPIKTVAIGETLIDATIPLAELSRMIPWPLLGSAAPELRRVLQDNPGVVRLEKLELPTITIGQPIDLRALLAGSRAHATLTDISIAGAPRRPQVEGLNATLELAADELVISQLRAALGAVTLPAASVRVRKLSGKPTVEADLQGELNLARMPAQRRRKLLATVGLQHARLRGTVALQAWYDHARPAQWRASGQLNIRELNLATLSPGGSLQAQGLLRLQRQRRLDLQVSELSGRFNGAPFSISGQLLGPGEADFLADLKLELNGLDLERLAPWLDLAATHSDRVAPWRETLERYRLAGHLSTDLDFFFLQSNPERTRAIGPVTLRQGRLYLPAQGLLINRVRASLDLNRNRYQLRELSLRANEQLLQLSGSLQNPQRPVITLSAYSPRLELDRLLPAAQPSAPPHPNDSDNDKAAAAEARQQTRNVGAPPWQLPELARQSRAEIDVTIDSGNFRGETFRGLALAGRYRHGLIESATFNARVAGGDIEANASASLLDSTAVPFTLDWQLEELDLARLTRLFSKDGKELMSGGLQSQGNLQGHLGQPLDAGELMRQLNGIVHLNTGPGKIPNRSVAANALFSILSLLNIQGIVSGDLGSGMAIDGLPYDQLGVTARFDGENLMLEPLDLITQAFSTRAIGQIGLAPEDMALDVDAVITLLGTIDRILNFVPIVGQAVSDLTRIYLKIGGTASAPSVRVQPVEGLTTGIGNVLSAPLDLIGGQSKSTR